MVYNNVMKFIVIHELRDDITGISIEGAGSTPMHRMRCWAIDDHQKTLFALANMQKLFSKYYLYGDYTKVAQYGLSFEELSAMISDKIGLDDQSKYEYLLLQQAQKRQMQRDVAPVVASHILVGVGQVSLAILKGMGKLLLWMLLLPFLIAWISKRK